MIGSMPVDISHYSKSQYYVQILFGQQLDFWYSVCDSNKNEISEGESWVFQAWLLGVDEEEGGAGGPGGGFLPPDPEAAWFRAFSSASRASRASRSSRRRRRSATTASWASRATCICWDSASMAANCSFWASTSSSNLQWERKWIMYLEEGWFFAFKACARQRKLRKLLNWQGDRDGQIIASDSLFDTLMCNCFISPENWRKRIQKS